MNRIRSITPTLCGLAQIPPPTLSSCDPLPIVETAKRELSGRAVHRMFIFCPDALGKHMWGRHQGDWEPVHRHAPNVEQLHAEVPSVTPVCFASMFTGAGPSEHGITKYEKPVLQCDTVFDAFARAGRRVAIIAVKGSSIDTIFRGRTIDYFSEDYDPQVTARTEALLAEGMHDVVLAYLQEYDDALHRTTPFSPDALQAMRNNIAAFDRLCKVLDQAWAQYDRAILFSPDHGGHIDPATGRGTHGLSSPDDLEVLHFFGLQVGR
jgi:predicted AlkP superfamily pyrophosphatase or phosphodiesterase